MSNSTNVIRHVAPTLAAAMKNDFAVVATRFIRERANAKVDTKDKNPEEIVDSLVDNSEGLQLLKSIDEAFDLEMKKLSIDLLADSSEAQALSNAPKSLPRRPQVLISIVFIAAYFAMLGSLLAIEASDTTNMLKGENSLIGEIQVLFGVLTAGVGQILSFWFGTGFSRKSSPEQAN